MVVLGLSTVFFLRSVGEKRVVDAEKIIMQAESLAEAGANHGLAELRKRVGTDLSLNVSSVGTASVIGSYYTGNNPLGFLRDFAYSTGNAQFTIQGCGTYATLSVSPTSFIRWRPISTSSP